MPAHGQGFPFSAPELARLATEAKAMAGLTTDAREHHHDFSPVITTKENKPIHKLTQTIKSYTDPFSPGHEKSCVRRKEERFGSTE